MKFILITLSLIFPFLNFAQDKGVDVLIDEKVGEYTGWFVNLIFKTINFTDTFHVPWVLIVLVAGALF